MFKGLLQSKDEKELSQLKFLLKEMFSDGRSSTAREVFVDACMNYLYFSLDVSHTDASKIFMIMLYKELTMEQKIELDINSLSQELTRMQKDTKIKENKGSISDFIATLYLESILNTQHTPSKYFSENDKNVTIEYIANTEEEEDAIREIFNKAINKVFHQNNIWNIQPYLMFKKEPTDEN